MDSIVNNEFYKLVNVSIAEASRTSDQVESFVDQYTDQEAGFIEFSNSIENEIFNRGVIAGATNLLDQLQKEGYKIVTSDDKCVTPTEDKTFSSEYLDKLWTDVSN